MSGRRTDVERVTPSQQRGLLLLLGVFIAYVLFRLRG